MALRGSFNALKWAALPHRRKLGDAVLRGRLNVIPILARCQRSKCSKSVQPTVLYATQELVNGSNLQTDPNRRDVCCNANAGPDSAHRINRCVQRRQSARNSNLTGPSRHIVACSSRCSPKKTQSREAECGIKPSTTAASHTDLSVCLVNAQSCRNKAAKLSAFVLEQRIDVLGVTETWLRGGGGGGAMDDAARRELTPPGYVLLDIPRPLGRGGRGGGVAVLANAAIVDVVEQRIPVLTSSYECIEVLVSSINQLIRMLVVYRPPSNGKQGLPPSVFFDEFAGHIQELETSPGDILITGDFNFHFERTGNTDVMRLRKLLLLLKLKQHVVGATHKKGHVLDLVMSRRGGLDVTEIINHGNVISDHSALSFEVAYEKHSSSAMSYIQQGG